MRPQMPRVPSWRSRTQDTAPARPVSSIEAEEGFPAVAQFLKRLVQGRDAVESDQFGLDRIRSALEIP